MNQFVLMYYGFETPTQEVQEAWGKWFALIKDRTVSNTGLGNGKNISKDGVTDLPFGANSLTGISIINAESLEEATELAQACPLIDSIRVYQVRG